MSETSDSSMSEDDSSSREGAFSEDSQGSEMQQIFKELGEGINELAFVGFNEPIRSKVAASKFKLGDDKGTLLHLKFP